MMSNIQQAPPPEEQENDVEVPQRAPLAVASRGQRSTRLSARRRRNAWLLLAVLLLGVVTIAVLSNASTGRQGQATVTQPAPSPTIATKPQSTTPPTTPSAIATQPTSTPTTAAQTQSTTPPTTPSAITATPQFSEYPLPQSDSQVMRLVSDHEGRLWFGEMGQNYLAVFDPRTQTFQQMTPPHGGYGMMGMQVAPDDTIWFAEQYANYIGHYFPTTGHFQIYPLPRLTIPDPGNPGKTLSLPSAPNELTLDAQGNVWFTEFNADTLGRLDPHTGLMQHYPLSATRSVQTLFPYGVTIDPQGMVWFTESSNDHIGRLDPATDNIRFFTPPGPTMPLMEIASDAQGTIWATSFNAGLLFRLDPRTGTFTSYSAPFTGPDTGGLYGLVVTPTGEVWVTVAAENVLARLDMAAHRFIYYRIPTAGSLPLALAMGPDHTLWFTEVDKISMLRP